MTAAYVQPVVIFDAESGRAATEYRYYDADRELISTRTVPFGPLSCWNWCTFRQEGRYPCTAACYELDADDTPDRLLEAIEASLEWWPLTLTTNPAPESPTR